MEFEESLKRWMDSAERTVLQMVRGNVRCYRNLHRIYLKVYTASCYNHLAYVK